MKGASVFLGALSILTVGGLGVLYLTKDGGDVEPKSGEVATDASRLREKELEVEREKARLELEKLKLQNEQLQKKNQAPSEEGLEVTKLPDSPTPTQQDEIARLKAENERLRNAHKLAQEETEIITTEQRLMKQRMEERQESIAQAPLVGKVKEYRGDWNIVVVELIGQPGLKPGATLGIRRQKGIVWKLNLDSLENGNMALASCLPRKFGADVPQVGKIEVGDEVVLYPETDEEPIKLEAKLPAPKKTDVLPSSPASVKEPKHLPIPAKPKLPAWPKE